MLLNVLLDEDSDELPSRFSNDKLCVACLGMLYMSYDTVTDLAIKAVAKKLGTPTLTVFPVDGRYPHD